jgi:hypothetical protein
MTNRDRWRIRWRIYRFFGGTLDWQEWCIERYWGEGKDPGQ